MKGLIKKTLLCVALCLMVSEIKVDAAAYGSGYTFNLQPSGGYGDMSSSMIKQNHKSFAVVYVSSYNAKGYYTRYFVTGAQRSWDTQYASTGSFNVYYPNNKNGFYHKGESHRLNAMTSANNPKKTIVSGSWTP